ncbi:MAG: hypothetical protein HOL85_05475 [Rhodospirillaceae bacterium]|nr:hypothetical protein [Rhodospirillaceae bacterium]
MVSDPSIVSDAGGALLRAEAIAATGNYLASAQIARRAALLEQGLGAAYLYIGLHLLRSQREAPGQDYLRRGFIGAPDDDRVFGAHCRILLINDRTQELLAACDLRIATKPNSAVSEFWIGRALRYSGNVTVGEHHLRRAKEMEPSLASEIDLVMRTATPATAAKYFTPVSQSCG